MKKLICFALLLLVLTVSVCAANIGTAEELVTLMNTESMWSGDYVLTNPINLDGYKLSPIGTKETPFTGTFDGAGYEISNIYLEGEQYVALFGYIQGATITDLTISGTVIATGDYSGGLIAYASKEMYVSRCHNKCNVTGIEYTGGICGYATGSDKSTTTPKMHITECMNSGTITCLDTAQSDAGGIAGSIYGVGNVSDCFNEGLVTTGNVSLEKPYIAGIVGKTGSYGRVTNCYNITAPMTPSEATTYVRAIVGRPNVKNGANNFFKDGLGMSDKNYGSVYSEDKFDTLNANGLWVDPADPRLACFYVDPEVPDVPDVPDVPVEPEIPDVTLDAEIATADQLLTLMHYPHLWEADYTLVKDIDLSTATLDLAQKPIGSEETPYSGIFDGAGYEISNLNLVGETHVALFAYVNKATIKNLTVSGTVTASGRYAAGIVAYAGTDAVRIEKCHNQCTVTGMEYIAGIVAYFKGTDSVSSEEPKSVIDNCWNSGTINALDETQSDAGGIVGSAWNIGWIKNCLNTGRITTCEVAPPQPYLGGICGKTYSFVRIENCYNAVAPITASESKKYVRGIAGYPSAKNSFNNFYKDGLGMSDANCGEPYSVDTFSLLNVYGAWVDKNEPKLAAFYACSHESTEYRTLVASTCTEQGSATEVCTVCFGELGTVALPLDKDVHVGYTWKNTENLYVCNGCDKALDAPAESNAILPVSAVISDSEMILTLAVNADVLSVGFAINAPEGATLVKAVSNSETFSFVGASEYANPYRMAFISNTSKTEALNATVTLTYELADAASGSEYVFAIDTLEAYDDGGAVDVAVADAAVQYAEDVVGDLNGDGSVTVVDVLTLIRAIVDGKTNANADVNGDGKADLLDVIRIIKLAIQ